MSDKLEDKSQEVSEVEMLMTPLTDPEHLQLWLQKFIGLTLPDVKITKYANATPLSFVWEVYRAIMDGKSLHIMGLSGRDSGKTVALSIMDLLSILHDQRAGLHSAMTKAQATRARDYLTQYINKQPLLRDAVTKDNTTKLDLMIGGSEVGLELISLTPKAVQGAHYSFVSVDELASSMDPQQIKAYRDLSGIPGTSSKGKPAVIVKITSRQSGASLAEMEVKNAHKSGIVIRKWTTIDSMKKCEDWRSGTEPLPLWINITKGLRYTEEEYRQVAESEKEGFEFQPDTFKGCYSCPLAVYCQGQAKKQTGNSVLLRSVDDVIAKVNAAGSHEWVLSQIMSLQPSNQGLVYPDFNQDIHIKSWDQMYEILTDEKFPSKVTRDIWYKEARKRGVIFYGGIDWGYANPSTAVVFGVDQRDRIYVVEAVGALGKNDSEWVEFVKANIHYKWNVHMWMPDSESKSGLDFLKKAGLPRVEIDKGPGSVLKGINIVRSKLRVPGTNSETLIYFNSELPRQISDNHPGIIEEFAMYSKEQDAAGNVMDNKVIKANDHHLDALRYAIYWLYGKAVAQAVFATTGGYNATHYPSPTGPQLAEMQGINFQDNREETKNLTDPNRNPFDDDDDDDPNGGTSGGGLKVAWT
jgi:hypothetical protein